MTGFIQPKSLLFASREIPREDPGAANPGSSFALGDRICFRACFEKTFADYVQSEKAVGYIIRFFAAGEAYQSFASMHWGISADQGAWLGFQDEIRGEALLAFGRLASGMHRIDVRVYMQVPNPNKQYQISGTGAVLNIRDASGTMDGSLAATGQFEFHVPELQSPSGVNPCQFDALPAGLKSAVAQLRGKDFMQRLEAAEAIKSAASGSDFALLFPAVRETLLAESAFGPVSSTLLSALLAANRNGHPVQDLLPHLVSLIPQGISCTLAVEILEKHPGCKSETRALLEREKNLGDMEIQKVLQACL